MKSNLVFILVVVLLILASMPLILYGGEENGNEKKKINIPSTTNVLDEKTLQHLSFSENGSVLVFASVTPVLESLSIGDVIVGVVSKATPYGLAPLRVIAVKKENLQIMVKTTSATLEHAIKKSKLQS